MIRKITCTRMGAGEITREVAGEVPVAIFVDGRHLATVALSPGGFRDFITGYLYTEEIVRSPGDIESVRIEENRISVITKNPFRRGSAKKTILSGCGGAVSYIDPQRLPAIDSDLVTSVADIKAAIIALPTSDMLDTVAIIDGGRIVVSSMDIDRHNALDRVIGQGLARGLDFSRMLAVGTGTVTSEMVRKCLVAGIPVLVSTGPPTALAVEIARETGLCIVGDAGTADAAVYTHPERIQG